MLRDQPTTHIIVCIILFNVKYDTKWFIFHASELGMISFGLGEVELQSVISVTFFLAKGGHDSLGKLIAFMNRFI